MPQFLAEEIQDYLKMLYGIGANDRSLSPRVSLTEMDRGSKEAGVPSESTIFVTAQFRFSSTWVLCHSHRGPVDMRHRHHLQLCTHLFQTNGGNKLNMERQLKCQQRIWTAHRWRNKTRPSAPREDSQIETAVKLTGLTTQDYIIRRLCRMWWYRKSKSL